MRKFLSVLVVTGLLLAQDGAAIEALAGDVNGGAGANNQARVNAVNLDIRPANLGAGIGITSSLQTNGSILQVRGLANAEGMTPAIVAPENTQGGIAVQNEAAPNGGTAALETAPAGLAVGIEPEASVPSINAPDTADLSARAGQAAEKKGVTKAFSGLRQMLFGPKAAAEQKTVQAFDGSAAAKPLDADNLTAILIRQGEKPVTMSLAELSGALTKGDYSDAFNKNGHLRVVLADGDLGGPTLSESDVEAVKEAVRGAGLSVEDKRTRTEAIHVTLKAAAVAPAQEGASAPAPAARPKSSLTQYVVRGAVAAATIGTYLAIFGATNMLGVFMLAGIVSNLDRLVKETGYSLTMLKAALRESKHPGWTEVVGGLLSKVIPAVINIGVFAAMYRGHPVALALSVALSLVVETFHGVWVNAWDTFQSKIGRHRGPLFQNLFNFFYGQLISGSYRTFAFFALGMAPVWSWAYWKPMIIMTVIGTFCGTLGYRGLNSLYEKGRVPRKGRAAIQQGRDLLMMLIGPFFATGQMLATVLIFAGMQSIDLIIYAIDRRTETRPIVYIADSKVAQSEDFRKIYLEEKSSAVKDALEGVKGFILVKPFVALYRWAKARLAPQPNHQPAGKHA